MTFFSFLDSYIFGICLYIYIQQCIMVNGIGWYLCKMGSTGIPAPFSLIRMVWSCSGKCRHRTCNRFIVSIHNLWSLAHVLQSSGWLIKVQASWCNICIQFLFANHGTVNTNERSTRLSFLCNSFLVLHPIYWCTYYIPVNIKKILCRRTLPILKFFASVSFWIFLNWSI